MDKEEFSFIIRNELCTLGLFETCMIYIGDSRKLLDERVESYHKIATLLNEVNTILVKRL